MASRNLSKGNPAKNIGANPPTKNTPYADGVVREEKLNPIPFARKMVDLDGNVVTVSLATGFTIRGFKGNDYGVQVLEEKLAKGFIPYDECPIAKGHLPVASGSKDKPCPGDDGKGGHWNARGAGPGNWSRDKCCEHVERVIRARRAAKQAKEAELAKQYATKQDRMIALLEKQNERLNKPEREAEATPLAR